MPVGRVFGYVAHGGKTLSVLEMSSSGGFKQIQECVINDSVTPESAQTGKDSSLCVSPDRRFLYAANRTAPHSVRSFAINGDDGTLEFLDETPIVESCPFLSTDATGRFLLAAYNPSARERRTGYVSVSTINEGFVQPPHQVLHTPQKAHAVRVDASNRFVMVPACDADVIARFGFDEATGLLNPNLLANLVLRPQTGPRHFVFHPNQRFVYANGEYDGSLYVYSFDPRDGAMSELQIASVRPPGQAEDVNVRAGDLHISPDGRFLFSAVRSTYGIATMKIEPKTGLVSPVAHTPVDREPRGFNIDPYGRFLIVNGLMTNTVVTYAIDRLSGELKKVASFASKEAPNWIELVRLS